MTISRDVSPRHVTCHLSLVTRPLVARCSWHSLTLWTPAWLLTPRAHNTRLWLADLMIIIWMARSAYYEKICLRSPACEKAWIFERAVGYLLQVMMMVSVMIMLMFPPPGLRWPDHPGRGREDRLPGALPDRDWVRLRLRRVSIHFSKINVFYLYFSSSYDYSTRECKLSRESRRTQPGAYR